MVTHVCMALHAVGCYSYFCSSATTYVVCQVEHISIVCSERNLDFILVISQWSMHAHTDFLWPWVSTPRSTGLFVLLPVPLGWMINMSFISRLKEHTNLSSCGFEFHQVLFILLCLPMRTQYCVVLRMVAQLF